MWATEVLEFRSWPGQVVTWWSAQASAHLENWAFCNAPGSPRCRCWPTEGAALLSRSSLCCSSKFPRSHQSSHRKKEREEPRPFPLLFNLFLECCPWCSSSMYCIKEKKYSFHLSMAIASGRGRATRTVHVSHVVCPHDTGTLTQWTGTDEQKTAGCVLF